MAELEHKKQEKIHELTDRIGEAIIDLTAEYEGDLEYHQMYAAITFAAFCTIASMMQYKEPGNPEEWYEERSYERITKMLTDYRSSIVDNPQETDSNK
ncbi:MAG: hypothetical protein MJZ62_07315 [Bacteroidales bacterium]|nr:hypothetical protein [Bacteroidales bacterium]